jgi:hypothetical protein
MAQKKNLSTMDDNQLLAQLLIDYNLFKEAEKEEKNTFLFN